MANATESARWVFIDDADPSIRYSGPWFQSSTSLADAAVSGPIYDGTQHGVNGTASLAFSFSGTNVRVIGTSAVTVTSGGNFDPSWTCSVDGTAITLNAPSTQPQNQRVLCLSPVLPDGPHTLTVQVTSLGTPFWVDFMMITPSLNSANSLSNPVVMYTFSDPAIQYTAGNWQTLSDNTGMLTQQAGAVMFLGFNGTKATWYGRMPTGYPTGPSTGTYTLDNHPPVTFNITGLLNSETTLDQQLIFETPTVAQGPHNLTVEYLGASTPLVLEYMLVQNGDLVFSGSSTPPPLVGGDIDGDGDGKKTSDTGVIVGSVVGGIALLILIGTVFFLYRKLKERRAKRIDMTMEDGSPHLASTNLPGHAMEITPFMHENTGSPVPYGIPPLPASPTATTHSMASGGSRPMSQAPSTIVTRMSAQPSALGLVDSERRMSYMDAGGSSGRPMYEPSISGLTSVSGSAMRTPPGSSFGGDEKARLRYMDSLSESSGGRAGSSSMDTRPLSLVNADPDATLIHHEDSGIRMPVQQFVDVPPSYTPA